MASTNDDVYISIVPFAKDVNIGSGIKERDVAALVRERRTASSRRPVSAASVDLTEDQGVLREQRGATWTATSQNAWNGCVMDRDKNYDTTNHTPSSAVRAPWCWPQQYDACPVEMLGMTSVKAYKADADRQDRRHAAERRDQPEDRHVLGLDDPRDVWSVPDPGQEIRTMSIRT